MSAFGSPRTLGRFALLTELASSHLGPLWLVRDDSGLLGMARRVRLGSNADQGIVDRISEAAFTATEIDHPLLAKVTEVLLQGPEIGVLQVYVEGVTLRTVQRSATTRRKPIPTGVAVRLIHDLLIALAALHDYAHEFGELGGSLFGGVNPDSVLVATSGRLCLLDPLVAGAASTVGSIRNHSDRLAYTAPEQNEDHDFVDATSDTFCVGILLWELLAERRLFMGMGRSIAQKVKALKIPRLDELDFKGRPPFSQAAADVVAQALDRDRSQRFQSAQAMLDSLQATGLEMAQPDEVKGYLEEVAEYELRKQREATTPDGEALAERPAAAPRPPTRSASRGRLPQPRKRAPKQTLLGLAPPKIEPAAPPAPLETADAVPVEEPSNSEPPTLVADVASISKALEESQQPRRSTEQRRHEPVAEADLPRALAAPALPVDLPAAVAVLSDDLALDAELEAIYDDPVPVRIASIEPTMADNKSEGSRSEAPSNVAAALAEALGPTAGTTQPAPEATDLGQLLSPEPPNETRPSPAPATQAAPAVDALQSGAATAPAVPLIHDQRFGGPRPHGPGKNSFWGGILVGAVVAFVIVLCAVVVVLVLVLRRGGSGDEDITPAASTAPVQPSVPAIAAASSSAAPSPAPASTPSARPDETDETDETDEPDAGVGDSEPTEVEPRPRPTPRPRPKPTFVPDEI